MPGTTGALLTTARWGCGNSERDTAAAGSNVFTTDVEYGV